MENAWYNRADMLTVHNCGSGVYIDGLENSMYHALIYLNLMYGVYAQGGISNLIESSTIAYNGNGVIEGNYQVKFDSDGILRNSILGSQIIPGHTGQERVYCFGSNTIQHYEGDYNNLYAFPGGGGIAPGYTTFSNWLAYTNHDIHSISEDPKFVSATNGDFHLMSTMTNGTYVTTLGSWTNFATNSPCIDTGNIYVPNGEEPAPNGGVINIGVYGNTRWASRSTDTDGDGLSDTFEVYARARRWGLDPYGYVPFGTSITNVDTDGDGVTDYGEFIAGTDPLNPIQCFQITHLYPVVDDVVILNWDSVENRTYAINWSTNLMQGFNILATNVAATPPVNTYPATLPANDTFFRIIVELNKE